MARVDGDEFGAESEADDRDVELSVAWLLLHGVEPW
jgi:hypothetical protein